MIQEILREIYDEIWAQDKWLFGALGKVGESTRRERTLQTPSKHIFHCIFLIFNFSIDKHINAPFNGGICSSFKTSQLIRWSLIKDHHKNMSNLLAKFGGQVYSHSVTKADEGMLNCGWILKSACYQASSSLLFLHTKGCQDIKLQRWWRPVCALPLNHSCTGIAWHACLQHIHQKQLEEKKDL